MVDLHTTVDTKMREHCPHRRMRDLWYGLAVLDLRVDDAVAMFKKEWQMTAGQVAVFVDGRSEHRAAMLLVPCWIIGAATEERDAERGPADDHAFVIGCRPSIR